MNEDFSMKTFFDSERIFANRQDVLTFTFGIFRLHSANFNIFHPKEPILILNNSVRAFEIIQNDIGIVTIS